MDVPVGDGELVARLRAGDEAAFAEILDAWSPGLLRVARAHVSTPASAEEVVQETWLAVVSGLAGFEGRSSLRTWVFRILVNKAKTRGVREGRVVPFSALGSDGGEEAGPTVDPGRFTRDGFWTPEGAPREWVPSPEGALLAGEVRRVLAVAIDALPERQRLVVTLRDVQGLAAAEVCAVLGTTPENERVLLHRARAKLRAAVEDYYRTAVTV